MNLISPEQCRQIEKLIEAEIDGLRKRVEEKEQLLKSLRSLRPSLVSKEARGDGVPPESRPEPAPRRRRNAQPRICTVEGCERQTVAHGLCGPHYQKQRKARKEAPRILQEENVVGHRIPPAPPMMPKVNPLYEPEENLVREIPVTVVPPPDQDGRVDFSKARQDVIRLTTPHDLPESSLNSLS